MRATRREHVMQELQGTVQYCIAARVQLECSTHRLAARDHRHEGVVQSDRVQHRVLDVGQREKVRVRSRPLCCCVDGERRREIGEVRGHELLVLCGGTVPGSPQLLWARLCAASGQQTWRRLVAHAATAEPPALCSLTCLEIDDANREKPS